MEISRDNPLYNKFKELNVDVDGTLSRFVENDELYIKFLKRYPDEDRMQNIHKAFEANEKEEIISTVHKLKGVSSNLGMNELAGQCSHILNFVREDIETDFAPLLKKLDEDYYHMCDVIKENIGKV